MPSSIELARASLVSRIEALGHAIGAPEGLLPRTYEEENALWIDICGMSPVFSYELYYSERGSRNLLRMSIQAEDVLQRAFEAVTAEMVSLVEAADSRPTDDFRIQMFQMQEDLMRQLNPAWAESLRRHHQELLAPDNGRTAPL